MKNQFLYAITLLVSGFAQAFTRITGVKTDFALYSNETGLNGFSGNSAGRMVIGPGAVYLGYDTAQSRLFGATRGGSSFDPGVSYRDINADLPRSMMKGLRLIDDVKPMIKTNSLEVSKANLLAMFPGLRSAAGIAPLASFDILTLDKIISSDYISSVALVGEINGAANPVVFVLKNVLAKIEGEIKLANKDETVVNVTFEAFHDPAAPTVAPFEIRWPILAV
jgi:hypothetical protein